MMQEDVQTGNKKIRQKKQQRPLQQNPGPQ